MTTKSGAAALLNAVQANGVDTIFGLPGGQLDHFFDAMYHQSDKLTFIGSRHEQGAAYMAYGYAKSTGKVGAYTVVPGPGVLNTTAALCTAWANNTPVLCLTGQIPSDMLGKGIGALHEIPDQLATLKSLTKWADRIMTPGDAPAAVDTAFEKLTTGRPGPVSLEMPMDIMGSEAEVADATPFKSNTTSEPDPDAIIKAARKLAASKQPVIVVGGGAIGASQEIRELASMLQAPVVSFRNGRGVVSDADYLGQVLPAGYELWKTADVALGIGTRMEQQLLHWGTDDHIEIIRVDIDPKEITRITTPDVAIEADARQAVLALIDALGKVLGKRASREEELQGLKATVRRQIEETVQPQYDYLAAIREVLPEDGIFVDEITQVGFASWYSFPVYEPRQLITCGFQGTLGYGFATALGVKVGNPDKPVVAIAGDGGFMFNVQELATAAQYQIPLVTILFNNAKFGNVQRQQKEWFGGRLIGSDLKNPDFVKMAESFHVPGVRVGSIEEMKRELETGFARNGPTLIEVPVGDMAAPWPFIIRERTRGI